MERRSSNHLLGYSRVRREQPGVEIDIHFREQCTVIDGRLDELASCWIFVRNYPQRLEETHLAVEVTDYCRRRLPNTHLTVSFTCCVFGLGILEQTMVTFLANDAVALLVVMLEARLTAGAAQGWIGVLPSNETCE